MTDNAFRLDGRMALVVGAGTGIGRAIAVAFGEAGANVACLDLEEKNATETSELVAKTGAQSAAFVCDVANEASIKAAVAAAVGKLGPPRVLVNGAAVHEPVGPITEITPEWWTRVMTVNLSGAYLTSRVVIPPMAAAGGGSIIHIASQMGRVGAAGRAAYCTAKGGLIQLAKVMAVDHAKENIRVNTLSPGAVETRRIVFRHGSMEAARAKSVPLHPIGRLGQPEEIGRAALYLASDASSFMTGSDLLIDGGYTAV